MRCPECNVEFDYQINLRQGTHSEYRCSSCGQFLQWDQPVQVNEVLIFLGPPQACEHAELRKPDARIPLP